MIVLILMDIILLILLFLFYYLTGKDLLAPPNIMVMVFLLSITFAITNASDWHIDYTLKAMMLIILGIIVFFIPFFLSYIAHNKRDNLALKDNLTEINIARGKWILTVLLDLLILFIYKSSIISSVRSAGYRGTNIQWYYRNMTSLEGTYSIKSSVRLLLRFIDVSAYIGVFIYIKNNMNRRRLISQFLYLTPAIIYCVKAFMGGGRLDLLKIISYTIIILYILDNQRNGWNKSYAIKYFIIGICVLLVALPGFYYVLSFTGRSTTRTMFQSISTYVGGPIQHFNQYIENPIPKSAFLGDECFTPILNTLNSMGIIRYHNTVHLEFRRLSVTVGNLYTFFRRPIQDFGVLGMCIFTFTVSYFFSFYYFRYIKNSNDNLKSNYHSIIYAYLLYWIVLSSIEQYSVIIVSVQTMITVVLFRVMWIFYTCIDFKSNKIIIRMPQ